MTSFRRCAHDSAHLRNTSRPKPADLTAVILAALTASDTQLDKGDLERCVEVLQLGLSLIVAGMTSGRVELSRAVAEVAKVAMVSNLYSDTVTCEAAAARRAAAIETIQPSPPNWGSCRSSPASAAS